MVMLSEGQVWRFDRFVLDPQDGGLFRVDDDGGRQPVQVGGRALDVLVALASRIGELVTKQAIMDAVWPGVAVEEKNLTVQISALRRALDLGREEGSYIQTVSGRGYRLVARPTRVSAEDAPEPAPCPSPAATRILPGVAGRMRRWRGAVTTLLGLALAAGLRRSSSRVSGRVQRSGLGYRSSSCRSSTWAAIRKTTTWRAA